MGKPFQVVPWFNSKEWLDVYEKIFSSVSTSITKKEALNVLYIWKARSPFLPSGIESTLSLLEVYLQDIESDLSKSDYLIRLAYSTALMRYVNHMLDTETAKGVSLYKAAKYLGVPDWIVDLRHDTAHSNKLPPHELLKQAAIECLDWLKKHYWDNYKKYLSDYITTSEKIQTPNETQIAMLINFCVSLSICSHSKCHITYVSQIPDSDMIDSLINDAVELFDLNFDFSQPKTYSISMFNKLMNSHAKKLFSNNVTPNLQNVLLSEDSLFLSKEVYSMFHDIELKDRKKQPINSSYIQCFGGLLYFLHSHDLLLQFIMDLIDITQNETDSRRCKLAAQWISVILNALKNCQQFIDRMKKSLSENMKSKEDCDLISLYHHWYPNSKNSLLLNLRKPIPQDLLDINFIQAIVSKYNPYLTYFIVNLLNLCQPPLPKKTFDTLCKLAKLIAFPENFPVISSRVYTANDISEQETSDYLPKQLIVDDNIQKVADIMDVGVKPEDQQNYGIWTTASSEHAWSSCPVGVLPWQLTENNKP